MDRINKIDRTNKTKRVNIPVSPRLRVTVSSSSFRLHPSSLIIVLFAFLGVAAFVPGRSAGQDPAQTGQDSMTGTVKASSESCEKCHKNVSEPHQTKVSLTCVECHGGNGVALTKEEAHVKPLHPEKWRSSANPQESFTLLNNESREWIRFVNPADLRAADLACGKCHQKVDSHIIGNVKKSSMTTSAQVYSTALYNNGSVPFKDALFGENYSPHGQPQAIRTVPPPTTEMTRTKGILSILWPLPRFEIGQPLSTSFLRVFERGGGPKSEVGNPNREDIPGQPDETFSNRGFGTQASVDPVILGALKVRLNDPVMSFMGTNNAPGDYRQSGCAACHVLYANDREGYNSGPIAKYGNRGQSITGDPTIPKGEMGHPLEHKFTNAIPSSQCITCHVHNGNGFTNTYLGYMWWDEQTDGEYLYPKKQHDPTPAELDRSDRFNPEQAAARGLWSDPNFLFEVSKLNPQLRQAQFSDYHGHGWMFTKVFKRDRKGNFLDQDNNLISFDDPSLFPRDGQPGKAVHLKDIHLEKGMHCVDCHFRQDNHGNGNVYGDRRAAIEIRCEDCHGTPQKRVTLADTRTSGPAAAAGGTRLGRMTTPFRTRRFVERGGKLFQRSSVESEDAATGKTKEWEVVQVIDTITPGNDHYNAKAARAKTLLRDNNTWGKPGADVSQLAHSTNRMSCVACHSSWITNCFGCHLSASVNTKKPMLHYEGDETQVYPSYNPQILRSDAYMLGIDGTVQGHKVMPVRSSSGVSVSVQNAQRETVINHAPTISDAGYNGNAFNTHVPHTVRKKETRTCSDCHVSAKGDNNAWLASTLLLGSNQVNFMGRYIYVAEAKAGLSATLVAEETEPQAVFGSHLQSIAYPNNYARHRERALKLIESHAHRVNESNQVQMYGEFLLSAGGHNGFIVYDIANVANKGFNQRIVTAPFSRLGQSLYVRAKDATGVAVGSPAPLDPRRKQLPVNEELPVAALFGYAFISDRVEGLITVDITTLTDGVPTNDHLKRAATYNPDGKLNGARRVIIVGNYAYLLTDRSLAVVRISNPARPELIGEVGAPALRDPRSIAVQFRYAFVTDADGLKVLDVTDLEHPRPIAAGVPLRNARGLYLARTYAYVADGQDGLAIVDIEQPEQPRLAQLFNAGGQLNDAYDVKVGMMYAGLFAYVADGRNGLKVVELSSPQSVPGNQGYSPPPAPKLIAWYATKGTAMQVSEGYRRDRGVDESGNQIAIFGRRGARPFNFEELRRMYLIDGQLFTVTDEPGKK
jgi:hypothetical protein